MGKNLKGKECGKGIAQRMDGRYSARFVAKTGRRIERHFTIDSLLSAVHRFEAELTEK